MEWSLAYTKGNGEILVNIRPLLFGAAIATFVASGAHGQDDNPVSTPSEIEIATTIERLHGLMKQCSGPQYRYAGPKISVFDKGIIRLSHMRKPGSWGDANWEEPFIIGKHVDADSIEYGSPGKPCGWTVRFSCKKRTACIGDIATVMYAKHPDPNGERRVGEDPFPRPQLSFVFGADDESTAREVAAQFAHLIALLQSEIGD